MGEKPNMGVGPDEDQTIMIALERLGKLLERVYHLHSVDDFDVCLKQKCNLANAMDVSIGQEMCVVRNEVTQKTFFRISMCGFLSGHSKFLHCL